MHLAAVLFSIFMIFAVLWEAFETVILPRRIQRKLRFTRYFYLSTWKPWRSLAFCVQNPKQQETMLSFFGPLSLVILFAAWAALLLFAFGILQWGLGSQLKASSGAPITIGTDLYMSGTTLFTLGLGDITPQSPAARFAAVVESAIGLGLVAMVISYLPTLYQAFARREVNISLLDARAGSPPTASEFLKRYASHNDPKSAVTYLAECERWASELLESHMSYPALCYFRSQHANQSWLSGLTMVLDVCVLIELTGRSKQCWQAELTFAMARHAVVDLSQVFHLKPQKDAPDRMRARDLDVLNLSEEAIARMRELRELYEPYANVLAQFLLVDLPPWTPPAYAHDNWSTPNREIDRTIK